MLSHPSPEVVEGADGRRFGAHFIQPQGMARQQVESQMVYQLFICPAKSSLQNLAAHEDVDGRVGAGFDCAEEGGEQFFGNAGKDFLTEGVRPRGQQALLHLGGHQPQGVKKAGLLVGVTFAKQGRLLVLICPYFTLIAGFMLTFRVF
jgi:hypothetical protein